MVLFLESAGQIHPETSLTFESPKCVLTSVIIPTCPEIVSHYPQSHTEHTVAVGSKLNTSMP
jgi:hypothetical protein